MWHPTKTQKKLPVANRSPRRDCPTGHNPDNARAIANAVPRRIDTHGSCAALPKPPPFETPLRDAGRPSRRPENENKVNVGVETRLGQGEIAVNSPEYIG